MKKTFWLVLSILIASASYATTDTGIKKSSKIICDNNGIEGTVTALNTNGTLRVSWSTDENSIQQDARDCENVTPVPGKVVNGFKKDSQLICDRDGIQGTVTAVNANGTLRVYWLNYRPSIQQDPSDCENITPIPGKVVKGFKKDSELICGTHRLQGTVTAVNADDTLRVSWLNNNPSLQQDPNDCENITPIPGKVVNGFKKNSSIICDNDGEEGTVTAVNANGTLRVSWLNYSPSIQQDPSVCENVTILGGDTSDRGVSRKENLSPSYQNSTGTSSAHAQ